MPKNDDERPGYSTGPTSENGKTISSQNALRHGGRTQRLLVGEERQEDYDALRAGWLDWFTTDGQVQDSILEPVILYDWLLRRAERNHLDVEYAIGGISPLDWTDEQHHKLQLFLRYKTGAERSFYRAWNALRSLRKDLVREELSIEAIRGRIDKILKERDDQRAKEKAQAGRERVRAAAQKRAQFAGTPMHGAAKMERRSAASAADRGGEMARSPKPGEDVGVARAQNALP